MFQLKLPPEEKEVFSTGMPKIDELLGGGLSPEVVYVVIGKFGSGKTAFCQKVFVSNGNKSVSRYNKGENDLLKISHYGTNSFLPNYKENTYKEKEEHWKTIKDIIRNLKDQAVYENSAIIWTLPCSRSGNNPIETKEKGQWLNYADCLIIIENNRLKVKFNRYRNINPEKSVKIKFQKHEKTVVMCEDLND